MISAEFAACILDGTSVVCEACDTMLRFDRYHGRQVAFAPNGEPDCASETCRPCRQVTYCIAKPYERTFAESAGAEFGPGVILDLTAELGR